MTQPGTDDPSMELPLVAPLRKERRATISESPQPTPTLLSKVTPIPQTDSLRILDFDLETLAAGYADPAWVPDKITCISASWIGEDEVYTWTTGQRGYWSRRERARKVLRPFYELLAQADVVTGHNIERFDLRVFNAEAMRCNVEPVRRILVEDTMRVLRSKGFKKGLDNIAVELDVPGRKKAMSWAEWDRAYEDPTWAEVIERCETDVRLHKMVREEMRRRGWLKTCQPRMWRA